MTRRVSLEMSYEDIDKIITDDLKEQIIYLENDGDPWEQTKVIKKRLKALYTVLQYYLTEEQFEKFKNNKGE